MEIKLYWIAEGISHNAYNDGFLHNYKAVSGLKIVIDSLSNFELFHYTENDTVHIVLQTNGISIANGRSLDNAIEKLENSIKDYGLGNFIKIINENIEKLPIVPDEAPLIHGQKIKLSNCISMKSGLENHEHTKWHNSFNQ